jgi:Arc/MetJ family transcription regulator
MKVTAIISEELIEEAMRFSKASTVTEALKIALRDYVASQRIKELSSSVVEEPLEFRYSAKDLRDKNNS